MRSPNTLRLGAVGTILALTLAGCATGGADDPSAGGAATGDGSAATNAAETATLTGGPGVDVENKVITVGYIVARSGPVAAVGDPMLAGLQTYLDSVNDSGGIDGWTVDLLVKDNAYETQQHVQLFNEIKDDIALFVSFGTAPTAAVQSLVQREGILTMPQSWASTWGEDPNMAPVGTPYSIDMANGLDYVTEGGTKPVKVGIVYQDDDAGADFLRGYNAAKEAYGFEDVGQLPFAVGDTDFTAQVQDLQSAGAEVVAIGATPAASGPIVGTASSLGYSPQWLFMSPAFAQQLVTEDGKPDSPKTALADALTGTLVTASSAPWGSDTATAMAQMIEHQQEYAPDQDPNPNFTTAYAQGKVVEALLRHAIEQGDLTREGLLAARQSLGHVDLGGLMPDINYTEDLGAPSHASLITRIDPEAPGFLETVAPDHQGAAATAIDIGE